MPDPQASIVFLHGFPLDHRMWGPNVGSRFADWEVGLIDLPGFGDASALPTPDTIHGFSAAVARRLRDEGNGPHVIVGHSMGGYVALQLYADHPEYFSGLVLTNTRSEPDSQEAGEARLATADRLERAEEEFDVPGTVKRLLAPETPSVGVGVVELVRTIVSSARREALISTLRALALRPDYAPVLGKIHVPVLVIWGVQDQLIPPAHSRNLLAGIVGASGIGIENVGHLPSLEAPETFYGALRQFLDAAY